MYAHLVFASFILISQAQIICEDGYTCYEDSTRDVLWVKKDEGNIHGPTCQQVCADALLNNADIYHACDATQPIIYDMDSFSDIAQGLNFTCKSGGCWDSAPGTGMILVTRGNDYIKNCYFPDAEDETTTLQCNISPGNANCFGERFSTICPCTPKALDEACVWENPPNKPEVATFDYNYAVNDTSCISRINYWRKRACNEQWIECPPAGLPPMTECTCCHDCANSQAEYDSKHKAHASFTRCGDMSQGEGGGANCAAVIDAFVSERTADENGTVRCEGHCGPIVKKGCQTFFWGEYEGFYTLNWRSCNTDKCTEYCRNPTDNECFSSAKDIAPDIAQCESYESMESEQVLRITFTVFFVLMVLTFFVVNIVRWWKTKHAKLQDNSKAEKSKLKKQTKNSPKKTKTNA